MAALVFTLDPLGALLESIEFDATMSEIHSDSSLVTEHPVEEGEPISDYVTPNLTKITLEGFVTNTPVGSVQLRPELGAIPVGYMEAIPTPYTLTTTSSRMARAAQVSGGAMTPFQPPLVKIPPATIIATAAQYLPKPESLGGMSYQYPALVNRVNEIYGKLKQLQQAGTKIEVLTQLAGYPSMVVSSLSAPRTTPEDAITFSVELTQFTTARTATVLARTSRSRTLTAETRPQETFVLPTASPHKPDAAEEARLKGWLAEMAGL